MLSNESIVDKMRDEWREAEGFFHTRDNRVREWYEAAAMKQWGSADLRVMKANDKPTPIFDQIGPVLDTVAGTEITSRTSVKFLPRTADDQGGCDLLQDYLRQQREATDAEHEESWAYRDAMVCGVGCTDLYVDHSDEGTQLFCNKRVLPWDVRWDPRSRQNNYEDRVWDLAARWLDVEEISKMWGDDVTTRVLNLDRARKDYYSDPILGQEDQTWAFLYLPDTAAKGRPTNVHLVTDYQYWVKEDAYLIRYPDGTQSVHFSEELSDDTLMMMMQQGIDLKQMEEIRVPRWYRAFVCGEEIIEHAPLVPNVPTRTFITGFEDQTDMVFTNHYGFVARMMDPQRWVNKLLSQLLYIMSVNPKGALLAETGALVDPQKAQRDFASPDKIVWLNPGGLGRIDTAKPISLPHGMMDMMQMSMGMVPKAAHVNLQMMGGQVDDLKRTAASSVELIQKAGSASLAAFADSLRRYRRQLGRKYLKYFQKYANPATMVRVSGMQNAEFAPLGVDPLFHLYDVIVEEQPDSLTSQLQMWQTFTEQGLMQEMLQMGLFPMQLLPRMVPNMPEADRRAWEQHIQMSMGGGQGGAPPPQQGAPPPA